MREESDQRRRQMRIVLASTLLASTVAACAVAALAATSTPAQADPYRWCAYYGRGGSTNCYFMTENQCRASVSGRGGFCQPNPFYDGVPVGAPSRVRRPY